jgi:hypothetical protein
VGKFPTSPPAGFPPAGGVKLPRMNATALRDILRPLEGLRADLAEAKGQFILAILGAGLIAGLVVVIGNRLFPKG